MVHKLKQWARDLRRDVVALSFAARDAETPFLAKAVTWFVAAYALSPIDLIPDFIPVLGYLDDLIVVPLGIALAIRLVPEKVMERSRAKADAIADRPRSTVGLVLVVVIWLLTLTVLTAWLLHLWNIVPGAKR